MRPDTFLQKEIFNIAMDRWEAFRSTLCNLHMDISVSDEGKNILLKAFAFSEFVPKNLMRYPAMAKELIESGTLFSSHTKEHYLRGLQSLFLPFTEERRNSTRLKDGSLEVDFMMKPLRVFRRYEMLRIAIRDLAGLSSLDETLMDLSNLADAVLRKCLEMLFLQSGSTGAAVPSLAVLGLGKLGAGELNFSSDIDLIFAFDGGADEAYDEMFYQKIIRRLIVLLNDRTEDGFVYRMDLGLRPMGQSGPISMSCDGMEDYYTRQGRDWERYALIKARAVAGSQKTGMKLLNQLKPFIYRKYLDFGVFESLRSMKRGIEFEVQKKGITDNIKLGWGGIREIEFFGQVFQLIRGGVIPRLQIPQIVKVLYILGRENIVEDGVCHELADAYAFLRKTENRLQAFDDQQLHTLFEDREKRARLSASMGYLSWESFYEELSNHRKIVHGHFTMLLEPVKKKGGGFLREDSEEITLFLEIWKGGIEEERALGILKDSGFGDSQLVLSTLNELRNDPEIKTMSPTGRTRLDRFIPMSMKVAGSTENASLVFRRIVELTRCICRRTSYLSLFLEYPSALNHLAILANDSPWVIGFISRYPVLLDELLDTRTLFYPPDLSFYAEDLNQRLAAGDADDFEFQMEVLRTFKQVNLLRVAAADVTQRLPLMRVSDHLTQIAETIIGKVVSLSYAYLAKRHGEPVCELHGKLIDRGFAVIAYGKLGGIELGYGSDLDLVFLHTAVPGQTDGEKSIDNAYFFSRLGQRVLHMLSAQTFRGSLYDTDMRLRPSGDSGVLVCHVEGYEAYQKNEAWTWEHQALIRARAIVGSDAVKDYFSEIRKDVLTEKRSLSLLKSDVVKMREKLRNSQLRSETSKFDIKQGRGGIVDIEFLVQYLVLSNSSRHPSLIRWTDNVRLIQELCEEGIWDRTTAYYIRYAYLIFRAMVHQRNLKERSLMIEEEKVATLREFVLRTIHRMMT